MNHIYPPLGIPLDSVRPEHALNRNLSSKGVTKLLRDLPEFRGRIKDHGVKLVLAYATGATRSLWESDPAAANSFLQTAGKAFGGTINLISGNEEARLTGLDVSLSQNRDSIYASMGGATCNSGLIRERQVVQTMDMPFGVWTLATACRQTRQPISEITHRVLEGNPLFAEAATQALPLYLAGHFRVIGEIICQQLRRNDPSLSEDSVFDPADFLLQIELMSRRFFDLPCDALTRDRARVIIGAAALDAVITQADPSQIMLSQARTNRGALALVRQGMNYQHLISQPL